MNMKAVTKFSTFFLDSSNKNHVDQFVERGRHKNWDIYIFFSILFCFTKKQYKKL